MCCKWFSNTSNVSMMKYLLGSIPTFTGYKRCFAFCVSFVPTFNMYILIGISNAS